MIIDFIALTQQCAPYVDAPVAAAIVKSESSFNPFAIGVNRSARLKRQPQTYSEAVAIAKNLIAQGKNIDLGLGQINSANLRKLNLSVEQVLEPCTNLTAMQTILNECRSRASGNDLYQAFSCYNTGNHSSGFRNGYVTKVSNNLSYYMGGQNTSVSLNNGKNATNYINSAPKLNIQNLDAQGLAAFANNADTPTNLTMNYQQQNPVQIQQIQQRQPEVFFISERSSSSSLEGRNHKTSMIF